MNKNIVMAAGAVIAGIGSMYLSWNEKRKFEQDLQQAQKEYQEKAEADMKIIEEELKKN